MAISYFTIVTCNGDDSAEINLALTPLITEMDGSIIDLKDSFKYMSGKAVITNTNPCKSEIAINFNDQRMSNGNSSYTFKSILN